MHSIIFDQSHIEHDLARLIREYGSLVKLESAKSIVIKPNIVLLHDRTESPGCNTSAEVLSSVIKTIAAINKEGIIYLAESMNANGFSVREKFEVLGLPESLKLQEDMSGRVRFLDLSDDEITEVLDENFRFFGKNNNRLFLSKTLLGSDFTFSISNIKTHAMCGFSGASKNLFGCLPERLKKILHGYIDDIVYDLNLTIDPDIAIVDGFRGMQGNGPVHGDHVNAGCIVMADSTYEADVIAVSLIGLKKDKIKYLSYMSDDFDKNFEVPNPVIRFKKADSIFRLKWVIKRLLLRLSYRIVNRW